MVDFLQLYYIIYKVFFFPPLLPLLLSIWFCTWRMLIACIVEFPICGLSRKKEWSYILVSSSLKNVWFYFVLIVNKLVLNQLFYPIEQWHGAGREFWPALYSWAKVNRATLGLYQTKFSLLIATGIYKFFPKYFVTRTLKIWLSPLHVHLASLM